VFDRAEAERRLTLFVNLDAHDRFLETDGTLADVPGSRAAPGTHGVHVPAFAYGALVPTG
jgi:hypothetical protein